MEEGTVEPLKSGKFRLRVTVGYLDNGNPDRLSKIAKATTLRKAYVELDEWIEYLKEHGYKDLSDTTFQAFFETEWENDFKEMVEPRTFGEYKTIITQRFLPKLKNKKIVEINPHDIRKIVMNETSLKKEGKPLSRKTLKRHLNAVSSVFNLAMIDYRIINKNPVSDVKLPKNKNEKSNVPKPYSLKEIENLYKTLNTATLRNKAVILTAFCTGSRAGEIAALEEKDINFKDKTIHFHQRIVKDENENHVRRDGLKASNDKTVPAPDILLNVLKEFIHENKVTRVKLGTSPKHKYVFGTPDGKFVQPHSFYTLWKRYTKKNNLRPIRFHDLRHSSASFLLSDPTVSVKTVQELLGHKDYRTTVNIYGHALDESKQSAINKFDVI